jgi:GNAT superfamily N-acetyltransferase
MSLHIRRITSEDYPAWRQLWAGYHDFYQNNISDEVTQHTWLRIMDENSPVQCIVADSAKEGVIGMANYILHDSTWAIEPICYLQDMFVKPDVRANGTGEAMLDWLKEQMTEQGWARLYWLTKENNYRARGLYDKYTPHSGFVRYVVVNENLAK